MSSPFTSKTLAILRALKRNNDREWFRARKADYEQHVRAPMVEVIGRLAADFRVIAPELVADPKVSLFRIYRDTRFSEDKTPLKTNEAAHFPVRGLPKGGGAGLYFEVAPGWVWIGGGLYRPSSRDLTALRLHIADTHPKLHRIVTARPFTSVLGRLEGDRLTRVPRGYRADHPAADYLRYKQFLGFKELDAQFATSKEFYPGLLAAFRALVPLVRFLNEPLSGPPSQAGLLADAAPRRIGSRASM
jgi:uncharacterized protein (TIGR02453 family)